MIRPSVLATTIVQQDDRFAPARSGDCDALFAAILKNDALDLAVRLPGTIALDYSTDRFADWFDLSRALWEEQVEREDLARIVGKLCRDCRIDADDQLRFKHERARFKHLRFAFAAFGDGHRYPLFFDAITSVMGNLQDAFKNGKSISVRRNARLLGLLLHRPVFSLAARETRRFRPTSPGAFRAYMKAQAREIGGFLEHETVTARQFHDTRKIISRYRACYATIATTDPTEPHRRIAACIATINGLMGNFHDELMSRKLDGTMDYFRDRFPLQDEIRERLQMLVSSVG